MPNEPPQLCKVASCMYLSIVTYLTDCKTGYICWYQGERVIPINVPEPEPEEIKEPPIIVINPRSIHVGFPSKINP
jgi:hypothetical protein